MLTEKIHINDAASIFAGGSFNNTASGEVSTIPGGRENIAQSYGQTVVGVFNRAVGSATASDFNTQPIALPKGDDPLFIVGNGKSGSRTNAFEVSDNGHSTVYDLNPQAVASNGTALSGTVGKVFLGSTYVNNVIYAWRDISPDVLPNGTNRGLNGVIVNSSFGVKAVTREAPGKYKITLKVFDPSLLNTSKNLTSGAISANIVQTYNDSTSGCHFIFPSDIIADPITGEAIFRIRIKYVALCNSEDRRFNFIVTGKP